MTYHHLFSFLLTVIDYVYVLWKLAKYNVKAVYKYVDLD